MAPGSSPASVRHGSAAVVGPVQGVLGTLIRGLAAKHLFACKRFPWHRPMRDDYPNRITLDRAVDPAVRAQSRTMRTGSAREPRGPHRARLGLELSARDGRAARLSALLSRGPAVRTRFRDSLTCALTTAPVSQAAKSLAGGDRQAVSQTSTATSTGLRGAAPWASSAQWSEYRPWSSANASMSPARTRARIMSSMRGWVMARVGVSREQA